MSTLPLKPAGQENDYIYRTNEIRLVLKQNPEVAKDPLVIEYIQRLILHYTAQLKLALTQDKIAAIKLIAENIDGKNEAIDSSVKSTFACKKGCSFCCHINVTINEYEAKMISQYCRNNKIKINKKYLKKQLKVKADEIAFSSVSACVFLKNKECSIYPVRPLQCRKYFVYDNPNDCNARVPAEPKVYFNLETEALMSALPNAGITADRLPKMLLPYAK